MENAIDLNRVLIQWRFVVQILIAAFISTIALGHFVYIPESRNLNAVVAVSTSIVLWVFSFRSSRYRHLIQTLATFTTFLLPLTYGDPFDTTWMPFGYILFGLLFLTAFTMPSGYAYIFIFTISALHLYLTVSTSTDTLDDGLSWLYNLLVPCAFTFVFKRAFERSSQIENRFEILRAELIRNQTTKAIEDSKAAVNRQIHETILNTLSVISGGIKQTQLRLAKETLMRDLKLFDSLPLAAKPKTLHECVSDAVERSGIKISDFTISVWPDKEISPTIASVIADAITESLRNIQRHSQATAVQIEASITDQVSVRVVDNGVGIPDLQTENFGIRNTIKSSVRSIGGNSTVKSLERGGTEVAIHVPLKPEQSLSVVAPKTAGFFDIDPYIRAATQVGVLFLLFATTYYYSRMSSQILTFFLVLLLVVVSCALIIKWDSKWRGIIAVLGFIIQMSVEITFAILNPTCAVVGFTQWSINANGLTSVLLLIALSSIRQKIMWFLISRIAALIAVWFVPTECQPFPLATAVSMFFFLGLFLSIVIWGVSKLDLQIQQNQNMWEKLMSDNLQKLATEERQKHWSAISTDIRDFLQALAKNPKALLNPESSQFAATYAGRIRSVLSSESSGTENRLLNLLFLEELQSELSLQIDIGQRSSEKFERPLAYEVEKFLSQLIRESKCDSVRVRILNDENGSLAVFRLDNFQLQQPNQPAAPNGVFLQVDEERNSILVECQIN